MDQVDALIETGGDHRQKWIEAGKVKDLCDEKKVEVILQKRAEYLGIKPKKVVWCATALELQEKLSRESSGALLCDLENYFSPFQKSLEKQLYWQLGEFLRQQAPAKNLNDLFSDLRERILTTLDEGSNLRQIKISNELTEILWTIYTREKKFGPIHRLNNLWNQLIDLPFCAYLDCLWQCLPNQKKIKNYFLDMGEAYEAGMGIWIPSKTSQYVLPLPGRFFTKSAGKTKKKNQKIEWTTQNGAELEVKIIIDDLAAFKAKIKKNIDDKEILAEIEQIINLGSELLPILKKDYSSSGLTWETERIIKNYLKEIVESYSSLSQENRGKKRDDLLKILRQGIRESLEKILQDIEANKVSNFEVTAEFLRQTFSIDSLKI